MTKNARKGSALLIVLGMLAFIVVSAVAFSAYMRYSRLPSSYLRRSTATRELTKAALACAIDEIDMAVANNPYPGIGEAYAGDHKMNCFVHHVYCGDRNSSTLPSIQPDNYSRTTPVLTLEGLAYIPPHLVNEARYFSRLSPAAEWKTFNFDAGRYAFCAIDVSDCFDVNRMRADTARSSTPFADLVGGLDGIGKELGLQIKCQKSEIFEKMHRI